MRHENSQALSLAAANINQFQPFDGRYNLVVNAKEHS
jgi:hypothetical protein